jgi:hypothetical protein
LGGPRRPVHRAVRPDLRLQTEPLPPTSPRRCSSNARSASPTNSRTANASSTTPRPSRSLCSCWLTVGLRWSELAALRVRRVDLMRRRLDVAEAMTELNGGTLVWGQPKSHEARSVPIPRFLADDLAPHLAGKAQDGLVSPRRTVARCATATPGGRGSTGRLSTRARQVCSLTSYAIQRRASPCRPGRTSKRSSACSATRRPRSPWTATPTCSMTTWTRSPSNSTRLKPNRCPAPPLSIFTRPAKCLQPNDSGGVRVGDTGIEPVTLPCQCFPGCVGCFRSRWSRLVSGPSLLVVVADDGLFRLPRGPHVARSKITIWLPSARPRSTAKRCDSVATSTPSIAR